MLPAVLTTLIRPSLAALALLLALDAAALPRDQNQRNAFKRANPCPATGQVYGRCPGYEVDHVEPLKCGGADRPANMQWLTVDEHKAKTKREHRLCRKERG